MTRESIFHRLKNKLEHASAEIEAITPRINSMKRYDGKLVKRALYFVREAANTKNVLATLSLESPRLAAELRYAGI